MARQSSRWCCSRERVLRDESVARGTGSVSPSTSSTLRLYRTVFRALMVIATLVMAGGAMPLEVAAGQAHVEGVDPTAPTQSGVSADFGTSKSIPIGAVRTLRPPIVGRAVDHGPPFVGLGLASCPYSQIQPRTAPDVHCRIRALERTRLFFAYESALARWGGASSFSTTLPPPRRS